MSKRIYYATNEDLSTIVRGLAPQRGDSILAVCGSGDQAFALAEQGAKVTAVDISSEQLQFVKRRYDALKGGDWENFFRPDPFRDEIMERTKRFALTQIRESYFRRFRPTELIDISFKHGDVLDELGSGDYNKVYLSNIFSCVCAPKKVRRFVEENKGRPIEFYDATAWRTWHVLEPYGSWKQDSLVLNVKEIQVLRRYFDIKSATRAFLMNEVQSWTPAVYTLNPN